MHSINKICLCYFRNVDTIDIIIKNTEILIN